MHPPRHPLRLLVALAVASSVVLGHDHTVHADECVPVLVHDPSPAVTFLRAEVSGRAITPDEEAEYQSFRYGIGSKAPNSPDLELIAYKGASLFQEVYRANP